MKKILQAACDFHNRVYEPQRDLFERLSRGQQPHTCLVTCSDSRICTELLTGCEPGEIFVVRNAGNLVPAEFSPHNSEAAALEIALSVGVRDVIVCGHSHCGAIKGLYDPSLADRSPAVHAWLRHAAETRNRVAEKHGEIDGDERIWLSVQENVLLQLEHLRSLPVIAQAVQAGELNLHGWVYRIESGEVLAYDEEVGQFHPLQSSRAAAIA